MPNWVLGLVVAAGVLVAATVAGLLWQRRDGSLRGAAVEPETKTLTELGFEPGTPATLLQFSSAFCAPCRATRRICAEISDMLDGVRHVEVDAESHLDAVRALGVLRTPTLFLLDRDGRIVRRASGTPTKPHLIAALAPLLEGAPAAG